MLDEIPDAHNALHTAIGHHQHMPDTLVGHDVEDVGNAIRGSARWWRRFHDVFRREIDAVHSVLGQRPDQQAIRDDADRPAAGIDDDDRGDISIHEEPRNVADRSGRPCRFDPVTFQVEYLAGPHRTSSLDPLKVIFGYGQPMRQPRIVSAPPEHISWGPRATANRAKRPKPSVANLSDLTAGRYRGNAGEGKGRVPTGAAEASDLSQRRRISFKRLLYAAGGSACGWAQSA